MGSGLSSAARARRKVYERVDKSGDELESKHGGPGKTTKEITFGQPGPTDDSDDSGLRKKDQGKDAGSASRSQRSRDSSKERPDDPIDADDSDLHSFSSLEEDEGGPTEASSVVFERDDGGADDYCDGKPVPRFADGSKCHPQRRCHFLEIPFGTSGALKRRVFEVRERIVEPCSLAEQVVTSQPCLRHASTSMVVVRWDISSWPEAKRITHFEVQWRQVGLRKGEYLEVYAVNPDEAAESGPSDHLEPAASRRSTDSSGEGVKGDSAKGLAVPPNASLARHEVICDGQFSTMPSAAIRQIDLRGEVRVHGLTGACAPLIFRVRTKLGHLGWGQWSPESEPIQTLPHVCEETTPKLVRASAHSLCLNWGPPGDMRYGKVVRYRLFAALAAPQHLVGDIGTQTYCEEALEALNSADDEDAAAEAMEGMQWTLAYEGLAEHLGLGVAPGDGSKSLDLERACKLLQASLTSQGSNLHAIGLERGLLPSSWPVLVRIEADMGSWFHGEFYENDVRSPVAVVRTLDPIPDPPPRPEILPYHGSVQARELSVRLSAAKTYGGGHDVLTYKFMFPGRDAIDWFGIDVRAALEDPKALKRLVSKRKSNSSLWKAVTRRLREEAEAEEEDLRLDGWSEIDPGHWRSSLSHNEQVERPYADEIPVAHFSLMRRVVSPDMIHPFKEVYRGPRRHIRMEKLDPATKYEFYVTMAARRTTYGFSEPSARLTASTVRPALDKISLPVGWVELWDPVSEYIYFHEPETRKIQWEHPAGGNPDDPDLRFRKLRFRLLHRLYERLPPAQNAATHKIFLDRKSLVKDSYREVGLLKREALSGKFNVQFEGENGIDSGGITTEWYQLLTRALFAPDAGIARCIEASKRYALESAPRGPPDAQRWHLDRCFMLGRIMAKAIYDKRVVNAPFCAYVYKHLKGRAPDMDDLRQVDPVFHQSLEWMLHNDITDMIFETMSLRDDDGIEHDLVPGGAHIDVTEDNKLEYVNRVIEWKLTTSVRAPLERICAGFHELLPAEEIDAFSEQGLELLVNGSEDIPVAELRAAARYANGFSPRSKTVQYFWSFFESAPPSKQAAVLAFATGSSKMPLEPLSLQIVKSQETSEALPTSHTCFQQLVIPDYEGGLAQLEEKFEIALDHAAEGGFGLT